VNDADVAVAKSDTLIPDQLKESLRLASTQFENVPAHFKDYHPGSDDKVVDLVHPSLFPLMYGISRVVNTGPIKLEDSIFKFSGSGEKLREGLQEDEVNGRADLYSSLYQWLPCDMNFTESGVRIQSYINNAHPADHRGLYSAVEQLITLAIPMWEAVLLVVKSRQQPRIPFTDDIYDYSGSAGEYGWKKDREYLRKVRSDRQALADALNSLTAQPSEESLDKYRSDTPPSYTPEASGPSDIGETESSDEDDYYVGGADQDFLIDQGGIRQTRRLIIPEPKPFRAGGRF
jgi:hypothetical protein